jgi:serine/threonine-protein kinase RsbW
MSEAAGSRPLGQVEGRLELSAPATPEIMELVHALVEQLWLAHDDVSETDRNRFETAVIEIFGNIVEHAYALEPTTEDGGVMRRFDVCLAATDDRLLAAFGDNGLPSALDLSDVAMPDELSEGGRGLALATALLDDLSYERIEGRNHWNLVCVRRPD